MSVTEEIKSRIDIVNYVSQYVPLKKAGRYYKACCPFHSEKTPSFVINADRQSWRCFGACAEGGDIFNFAQKQHGWSFSEALQELGKQAGVEVRKQSPLEQQKTERTDKLRGILQSATEIYYNRLINSNNEESQAALRYAQDKRGFTRDTITQYAIGYAPSGWSNMLDELRELGYEVDDLLECGLVIKNDQGRIYDRFRDRLMIPIRDNRGRVIGFGARALNPDDNPKYLNSPQTPLFDKSRVLFGLDVAKNSIRDSETVVIVEGYMDVIQAHQAGFMNVVAQMGTAMTESQLKLVAPRYAKKIILALDSDAAGQSATRRSLETARQTLESDFAGRLSVDIRILQIPGAKDPDDLIRESPETWQSLVDGALPVAEYVINIEAAALPANPTVQEREVAARRILPILVASEDGLYRQDNIQKLAMKFRIAERELLWWAEEQKEVRVSVKRDDEPPPLNYDNIEPPDFDDDDMPLSIAAVESNRQGYEINVKANIHEMYCLRVLCLNPQAYYQVNRALRELAGEDVNLLKDALAELDSNDFSRSDYGQIMAVYLLAMDQHEIDLLDFIAENLDPALYPMFSKLLIEDHELINGQLAMRFSKDQQMIWKQYQKQWAQNKDDGEVLKSALQQRLERIKRDLDEVRFLQLDAQQMGDMKASLAMLPQVVNLARAKDLLETHIQQNFVGQV